MSEASPKGKGMQHRLCWARNVVKKFESEHWETWDEARRAVARERYERAVALILYDKLKNS
jgi:hypothetical protein